MSSPEVKRGVYYGWWVVLACAVVYFYLGGTYYYGFTALFNPLVEDFGWSFALVSLAFSFRGLEAGIMAPLVGIFVDRFGPRKLIFCGVSILGLGFLSFGGINTLWSFYVVSLILALGASLMSPPVTLTAVVRWFRRRTSLAIGLLMAGHAAGGLLVPGVVWLIDQFGWRQAVLIFGAGAWLVCLPLALVVKEPQSEEYSPLPGRASSVTNGAREGLTAREILKTKDFWLLSTAVFFGAVAGTAIIVHQIPYLVSIGIPRQFAGFMTIAFTFSNIAGRIGFGWLGDILDKRYCFAIAAAIKAAGVIALALATNTGIALLSLIAMGAGFGGVIPLRAGLQTESFGRKAFGTVQGFLMVFITLGAIVAPPFAGYVYDLLESYRPAFLVLGATTVLAIPTVLAMSRKASHRVEVKSRRA